MDWDVEVRSASGSIADMARKERREISDEIGEKRWELVMRECYDETVQISVTFDAIERSRAEL